MLWITVIGWLARLIFLLLVCLSVWSISIIIERRKFFRELRLPGADLKLRIRQRDLGGLLTEDTFVKDLFKELAVFKTTEQIEKGFDAFVSDKRIRLEKGLPVLGTLGSTTPFIGLLGTVLGIIVSFGELSQGAGSTNSVMFSLAEALVLTALGLVVAIPAVIAFNFYSRKVRGVLSEAAALKDLFIAYRE